MRKALWCIILSAHIYSCACMSGWECMCVIANVDCMTWDLRQISGWSLWNVCMWLKASHFIRSTLSLSLSLSLFNPLQYNQNSTSKAEWLAIMDTKTIYLRRHWLQKTTPHTPKKVAPFFIYDVLFFFAVDWLRWHFMLRRHNSIIYLYIVCMGFVYANESLATFTSSTFFSLARSFSHPCALPLTRCYSVWPIIDEH